MRSLWKRAPIFAALLTLSLLTTAAPESSATTGFVTRSGTQFVLDGDAWTLYGASIYGTSNPGGQGNIANTVDLAAQAGLNTLRIVNFFDESGTAPNAPYNEADWARVDTILETLRANGMKAILDLSAYRNHLHNLAINTGSAITPYSQDWSQFIAFVAERVNTVNGLVYRLDPTIAILSFAGEPNPPNSEEPLKPTTSELTNFYQTVFAQWKTHDQNHLLSSGGLLHIDWEEAFGNPNGSGIDWEAIFALAGNDVPSIHSYWHNFPPTSANDYRSPKVSDYAASIGKPWITEEFGFLQTPVDYSTNPPTSYTEADRAAWYQLAYDIQDQRSSAGAAFWNLGTEVSPFSHDVNPSTPATWNVVRMNQPPPPGFVTADGQGLLLDGQPYRFIGTNRYNLLTLGGFPYRGCGDWWTESDVSSWLAELKLYTDSNAVRFWAFPLFTADATDFARLDFVLNEAAANDMKVIPVLENQWADCTSGGYKFDTWYSTGYKAPYGSYTLAYHDPASPPSAPTDYVGRIVDRYKDDPRILMWQLINEAEIATSGGGCGSVQILRDFAADVSAYIKAIDPNHLVSLGTIGSGQCGASGGDYQTLHDVPTIDLCEYHDYGSPAAPIPGDQWNGLQVRIDQCSALNKPLFIGESGIHACGDPDGPPCNHPLCDPPAVCYTKQERADFFDAKMDAFLNTSAGDGYLIWTYRDNYLMGQADNDPQFRFTPTDPLSVVLYSFGPAGDRDADGWSNGAETAIGTNANLACGTDAWPPDFNNDNSVTGFDLNAIAQKSGSFVPPAPARRDIAPQPPDGQITGGDLSAVASRIGRSCTP